MKRLLLAVSCLLLASASFAAEPTYSVTFGASVTNANESLSTRLTWSSSPAGATCAASGHSTWTGPKAASGALDLPKITMHGTYNLSLSCNWPADTQARLCWQAPTQYTDGSAIPPGGITGYGIYQGTSAANLTRVDTVTTGLCATRTGLALGTHYFAVTAIATGGAESARSGVGNKTITGAVTRNGSVSLTVNPVSVAPKGADGGTAVSVE